MGAWDRMYPISDWECKRAEKIEALQKSSNNFLKAKCTKIK